tara:strand:- start:1742 stop:1957 length:216 start_codon:yes stop_codon:yes gene_type:complete
MSSNEIAAAIDQLQNFLNILISSSLSNERWAYRRSEYIIENINNSVKKEISYVVLCDKLPEDVVKIIIDYL